MPRFVILEHNYPSQHWDLMLEKDTCLRAWRLLESPEVLFSEQNENRQASIKAQSSSDHRLIYLDYEGPISGNRGSVKRFDLGTFEWIENSDAQVVISLFGQKIKDILKLIRFEIGDLGYNNEDDWRLELMSLSFVNQLNPPNG